MLTWGAWANRLVALGSWGHMALGHACCDDESRRCRITRQQRPAPSTGCDLTLRGRSELGTTLRHSNTGQVMPVEITGGTTAQRALVGRAYKHVLSVLPSSTVIRSRSSRFPSVSRAALKRDQRRRESRFSPRPWAVLAAAPNTCSTKRSRTTSPATEAYLDDGNAGMFLQELFAGYVKIHEPRPPPSTPADAAPHRARDWDHGLAAVLWIWHGSWGAARWLFTSRCGDRAVHHQPGCCDPN